MARLILGMVKRTHVKALQMLSRQNKLPIPDMIQKANQRVVKERVSRIRDIKGKPVNKALDDMMAMRYKGQRPIKGFNPNELLSSDHGLPKGTTIDDMYMMWRKGDVSRFEHYGMTGYDPKTITDLYKDLKIIK